MQHIVRSNIYNPTFTLTECDGSAVDLSTSTVKFIVKKNKDDLDSNALLSKEYVNSDTNILQFEFTSSETKNLQAGNCICALKIYRDGGKDEEVWSDEGIIEKGVFDE